MLKTRPVHKAPMLKPDAERLFINPPHTFIGGPNIDISQSILLNVGGLRQMIDDLDDKASLRIEWFAGYRASEFSIIA